MIDKPLTTERVAVIALMAETAPFRSLGLTALMKCIYFLQILRGVPLQYSFPLFSYGPFDADVLDDLSYAEALGIVSTQVVDRPHAYGYEVTPGPNSEPAQTAAAHFIERYGNDVDWVMQRFGRCSAAALNLDSTIIFVDRALSCDAVRVTNADLASRVRRFKPQFTDESILLHIMSSSDLLKSI